MNITGRLTQDATVSTTPTGKEVVNFSVAINDGYKNKQGEWVDETAFIECAYWRSAKVASWLLKGRFVELSGRISTRAWLDKDGNPKAGMNFNTAFIKPAGWAKPKQVETVQASAEQSTDNTDKNADDSDLPF